MKVDLNVDTLKTCKGDNHIQGVENSHHDLDSTTRAIQYLE
jgi:hypothetical protein